MDVTEDTGEIMNKLIRATCSKALLLIGIVGMQGSIIFDVKHICCSHILFGTGIMLLHHKQVL